MRASPVGQVLIVATDTVARGLLVRLLQAEQYDCFAVASGREALDCLQRRTCNVMLCDAQLKDMDSSELLAQAERRAPMIEVILMGRSLQEPALGRAMRQGAFDCLEKPLQTSDVLVRVREAWDSSRSQAARLEGRRRKRGRAVGRRDGPELLPVAALADADESVGQGEAQRQGRLRRGARLTFEHGLFGGERLHVPEREGHVDRVGLRGVAQPLDQERNRGGLADAAQNLENPPPPVGVSAGAAIERDEGPHRVSPLVNELGGHGTAHQPRAAAVRAEAFEELANTRGHDGRGRRSSGRGRRWRRVHRDGGGTGWRRRRSGGRFAAAAGFREDGQGGQGRQSAGEPAHETCCIGQVAGKPRRRATSSASRR